MTVIGTNAYEYAGYTYNRTTHREATTAAGKDGCLECHFKATSQYIVGGHSFSMRADLHGDPAGAARQSVSNTAFIADTWSVSPAGSHAATPPEGDGLGDAVGVGVP